MVFSSPIFLFGFLPLVLLFGLPLRGRWQNAFLALASLLFYLWGEVDGGWVILLSVAFNYAAGRCLSRAAGSRSVLALAVTFNLLVLGWFKYGNFLNENLNAAFGEWGMGALRARNIHLPIGISFFTFHALSYLVDVHRGRTPPQKAPLAFALYMTFFPQLIAGPIVRYHDISGQLTERRARLHDFSVGVRRFVLGLGKKVLVANTLAAPVDELYSLASSDLTGGLAWLGACLYTLQIYSDFSAYSDMAIGLARMFGFTFLENFDYPYVSRSVTQFWRRWHISLSSWFRDYVYVPLGGNRRGRVRTILNLVTVFLLCGLWHGANWTFVVWGAWHGAFLVLERSAFSRLLGRLPLPIRHVYVLLVVVLGWVLFRADSFPVAWQRYSAMFWPTPAASSFTGLGHYLHRDVLLAGAVAIVGSTPLVPWLCAHRDRLERTPGRRAVALHVAWETAAVLTIAAVFLASSAVLASGTYNPFIYFRF